MIDVFPGATAQNVLEQIPLALLIANNGCIVWVNSALCELVDASAGELVGLTAGQARGTRLAPLFNGTTRLELKRVDGTTRRLERMRLPVVPDGPPLECFLDMTAHCALEEECERLRCEVAAMERRDVVTGLPNRKAIMESLEAQVSRSRRYNNPLALLQLSLQSSATPDQLAETLRGIGQALTDQLRWADQLGMLDPGSFLIILPETSLAAANAVAANLLRNRIHLPEGAGGVTVLLGVASWQKGDDPRKLLQRLEADLQPCSDQPTGRSE